MRPLSIPLIDIYAQTIGNHGLAISLTRGLKLQRPLLIRLNGSPPKVSPSYSSLVSGANKNLRIRREGVTLSQVWSSNSLHSMELINFRISLASIRSTCPTHRSRPRFANLTKTASLKSLVTSEFLLVLQTSPSLTGPRSFRRQEVWTRLPS